MPRGEGRECARLCVCAETNIDVHSEAGEPRRCREQADSRTAVNTTTSERIVQSDYRQRHDGLNKSRHLRTRNKRNKVTASYIQVGL